MYADEPGGTFLLLPAFRRSPGFTRLKHSSSSRRFSGIGAQTLAGKVHEGTDLGQREAMLRCHQMNRDRRWLVVTEQEDEAALLDFLLDLVAQDPDDAFSVHRCADRRLVGIHHEPRPDPHGAGHLPPGRRWKAPDILRTGRLDGDTGVIEIGRASCRE